ncbi:hypothetical protein LTR86_011112 [Recurvomyces mirabilis]|nr:hypothetical protein LTR86_011112 [Recurvomyces mirabilis]
MPKQDTTSAQSSKRKSSSTHHSEKQKRLEENGIYMRTSVLLQEESKEFCEELLERQHEPLAFPCYPARKINDVLERIRELNEARLQRDIMPWVVPSAENLHFSNVIDHGYIGEEINAEWVRCETMGSTRPKPDFAVGLNLSAFSSDEADKLQNYGTPQQPYLFTPLLSFPFLICEAKTGRTGLDYADTQNLHSASIATRAVLSLYISTFGRHHEHTKDLLGRILVFTVSHNNSVANLYGHYVVSDSTNGTEGIDAFRYFRYDIAMFSLSSHRAKDRFKAYSFIRNLYDKFAPQHLERIRMAIRAMSKPIARTGLSFAASDITLEEEGSLLGSEVASQEDEVFKVPSEPASVSQNRELGKMRSQLDRLLQQIEEQREESRRQLEEQREDSRKEFEQQREEKKAIERRLDQMMQIMSKSAKQAHSQNQP